RPSSSSTRRNDHGVRTGYPITSIPSTVTPPTTTPRGWSGEECPISDAKVRVSENDDGRGAGSRSPGPAVVGFARASPQAGRVPPSDAHRTVFRSYRVDR